MPERCSHVPVTALGEVFLLLLSKFNLGNQINPLPKQHNPACRSNRYTLGLYKYSFILTINMSQISNLFTSVVLLCALSSVWCAPNNKKGLRGMQTVLKCRVVFVDTGFENPIDNDEEFMCMPMVDEVVSEMAYPMILPDSFLAENADELYASDRDILIDGAALIDNSYVSIPEGASIQLIRKSRVVTVPEEYVTRKMLIVRVSTKDASPGLTREQMSEKTFAKRSLTMRSQYLACSHGKLTFDAAPDSLASGMKDGVLDIELDLKVADMSRQNLTNAAIEATQLALNADIGDVVDNVIICHPPGSKGSWVAYAFPNNVVSVYNDLWCGFLSSTMHEVGHNLGFLHSNQDGLYNDKTGYMGFSYGVANWPSVCFNGKKNWQAGWFSDRAIEVDPADGIYRGKLATFVDYPLTSPSENVVIKVGDLYLQYNRAKGMNFQTREKANQVTIVEDRPKGSELLTGVDGDYFNTTLFRKADFGENNETLFIAVCSKYLGDNKTKPDIMFVSIGLDAIDCSAETTVAPTESPAPSPSPSKVPTSVPTESPAPSPSPSLTPTGPTRRPSASPSRSSSKSQAPSPSPSKKPTTLPTWIEPDRGALCDDDMEGEFFVGVGIGSQNCKWLQEMPEMQEFLCVKGMVAYDLCAETCGKCSDYCVDNNYALFNYNDTTTSCAQVRQDPSKWDAICSEKTGAINHCRETCNSCPTAADTHESCDDSQIRTFPVNGVGNRRCAWLSQPTQETYRDAYCVPENPIFHICAETCGKCFDECKDDLSVSFLYTGQDRDCQWLSSKPLQWQAACGTRQDIREACPESCENCGD